MLPHWIMIAIIPKCSFLFLPFMLPGSTGFFYCLNTYAVTPPRFRPFLFRYQFQQPAGSFPRWPPPGTERRPRFTRCQTISPNKTKYQLKDLRPLLVIFATLPATGQIISSHRPEVFHTLHTIMNGHTAPRFFHARACWRTKI